MDDPLAASLPAETIAAVRAEVPALAAEILNAVRAESPVYADVLAAPEGMALRMGVEQAIRAFLDAVERGGGSWGGGNSDTDELWRALGEAEFQSGRGLDDLRAAFRTGIRAAWRGAAAVAIRARVSAPVAISLAEAIFVYGDALAGDVVEGYLRMQSDVAGERERRRRRLAAVLLDPAGPPDPDSLGRAADLAHWPLPKSVALAALAADDPGPTARRLGLDVLPGADPDGVWLVIPDPDAPGRAAAIDRALANEPAAIGPSVAPAEARRSLRWARLALTLAPDPPHAAGRRPVRADDHLARLVVLQDPELAVALAERVLAPLDALPVGERDRMTQTLDAWLGHQRHTPAVAAQLHVHPQTVRYRVARLRELLGEALETPDGRFELQLALRAAAARTQGLTRRARA